MLCFPPRPLTQTLTAHFSSIQCQPIKSLVISELAACTKVEVISNMYLKLEFFQTCTRNANFL